MMSRRTFVNTLSAAGIGAALAPTAGAAAPKPARRRYAIVGTGIRAILYQEAIEGPYQAYAELVGLCDRNPGRLEVARARSHKAGSNVPPAYAPANFERMIAQCKPDIVIVATMDSTHDDYIERAMQSGCDVITEKPMTTTAEKCQRILDARARTGRQCRVAFNYRYSPARSQVKDILMSGEIGEILSVDFEWLLDTHHGADYFRRWHRNKANSGGLLVHKATHHFDLVNWWLGAMPASVFATGRREFYTPAMAQRLGLSSAHERCLTCPQKQKCGFHLDLAARRTLKALYLDNEQHDGYFRDRCVFSPQIDIEDTMSVIVRYDNDVTLNYSLNAFSAWEGYRIAFNGTKGRLEHGMIEAIYVRANNSAPAEIKEGGVTTQLIPVRGPAREIVPWHGEGDHAGGDVVMLADLFQPSPVQDKYLRAADERAGAASILVGVAANRSIETGQVVSLAALVPHLARPEFAAIPARADRFAVPQQV